MTARSLASRALKNARGGYLIDKATRKGKKQKLHNLSKVIDGVVRATGYCLRRIVRFLEDLLTGR